MQIGTYTYDDDMIAATQRDREVRVRVYTLSGAAVVLGRGSDPEKEIALEACLSDRVSCLKRYGGGCAVLLDPGNIIVSLVLPKRGFGGNSRHFKALSAWIISGLARTGIEGVEHAGHSDLAVDGRKVGGACIYRSKDLLYYSATLLVKPDIRKVERYLKHPPREPAYRRGRSHREFMAALAPSLWPGTTGELARTLRDNLRAQTALCMMQKEKEKEKAV